jgi:hypothetical protein
MAFDIEPQEEKLVTLEAAASRFFHGIPSNADPELVQELFNEVVAAHSFNPLSFLEALKKISQQSGE